MNALKEWTEEVASRVEALGEVGIEPAREALGRELIGCGYPGVLPLWRDRFVIAGALGLPGVEPRHWPALMIERGEAATLATNSATLLPRFLMQRRLSNLPAAAEALAGRWPELADAARALHLSLGGAGESLEALAEVLKDASKRDAFRHKTGEDESFEAAHGALARAIDRSPEFGHYADWFDCCIRDDLPPVETRLYGVWARQALCWSFNLSLDGEPEIDDPHAPIALVEAFAGLDTAFPIKPSWAASAADGSSDGHIPIVAESVAEANLGDDAVQTGLVEALRAAGSRYEGYAHAEAVVALDERGEPERAWGALHSAAWWMARNVGEAPPAILDGARLLCDRHGWDDLRWVVDRNAGGGE